MYRVDGKDYADMISATELCEYEIYLCRVVHTREKFELTLAFVAYCQL